VNVVVLLGAPGAGKGTQAPLLSARLGVPVVATGDLFRAAVRDGTAIGLEARRYMDAGQLVPDDVVVRLLLERIGRSDAARGVILDGFPRTRVQAEALDAALEAQGDAVCCAPLIEVPVEVLVHRMSGRRICRAAGHVYHEVFHPPAVAGTCDIDGSELYQRLDDQPEIIRQRLDQQLGGLDEVVGYYRSKDVLQPIDGGGAVHAIADAIARVVLGASDRTDRHPVQP